MPVSELTFQVVNAQLDGIPMNKVSVNTVTQDVPLVKLIMKTVPLVLKTEFKKTDVHVMMDTSKRTNTVTFVISNVIAVPEMKKTVKSVLTKTDHISQIVNVTMVSSKTI